VPEPVSSVFNDAYVAEVYEAYLGDPLSVDESWRQLFRFAQRLGGTAPGLTAAAAAPPALAAPGATRDAELSTLDSRPSAAGQDFARRVVGISRYLNSIRRYGYLAVQLDPLGAPPPGAVELTPEHYDITEADLDLVTGAALGFPHLATGRDVAERLKFRYTRNLAVEFVHCRTEEERQWFRALFTAEQLTRSLTAGEKKALLTRLTEVDGLERFLGRAFTGYKRFSIEGTDALVPMLDAAIEESTDAGARHIAISMAHRGRINVLAHVLGKPIEQIFGEFQGRHEHLDDISTGDVKYHLGFESARVTASGSTVQLSLMPNPSHLEMVNPVLQGWVRAHQREPDAPAVRDTQAVVPVCIHGDAAFPGEGVVAETFNLAHLRAYDVGGTLHIIVNNQVGFTTDPEDARSTRFASDLAKGFEMPILHVNADDAEACVIAMRIAVAYRTRFGRDFLVDLVGYRRHGHNEGDEPGYTQPLLTERVKAHPAPRQVWGARLVREGIVSAADVEAADAAAAARFQALFDSSNAETSTHTSDYPAVATPAEPPATAVSATTLAALNEALLIWPESFHPHPRLAKQLQRRREAIGAAAGRSGAVGGGRSPAGEPVERGAEGEARQIDWGHAESLAFATILADGVSIRMSGQDVERGTFSHRHAVLHDVTDGKVWVPLQHLPGATAPGAIGTRASFEIYNSALSELAVLGFEYGYSTAAADTLTLWEAQFGDFVNVAQPIIDQFLAADRAKWGQDSGLVLLLPHGYEGQGPEHSSARLERFLQLCAEGNLRVAYPSTPAQYFHVLRRQAKLTPRRPLVLMQPKSLLRLAQAASALRDLAEGGFQPVLDDPAGAPRRDAVRRVVLCTGKIYYDLTGKPGAGDVTTSRPGAGDVTTGKPGAGDVTTGKPGAGDVATSRPGAGDLAVVRVEELYPWPHAELSRVLDLYPKVKEIAWVQEEPKNQGAWSYVSPRLRGTVGNATPIRYIGRSERASPAEGFLQTHEREQARIVSEALAASQRPGGERRSSGVLHTV